MKVKLELEFELKTNLEESDIIKTKKELLNGIKIEESDIVDGFLITTDLTGCNNTEDFFINPHSASITAIKAPEFSKEELSAVDIDINDNFDGVSCQFASIYDTNEKFGIQINEGDNARVNFYAEYFPANKELKCEYYLCSPLIEEGLPYSPTEEEKQLIISAMEEFCQDNYGENIMEFIQSEKEAEEMNMGGVQ